MPRSWLTVGSGHSPTISGLALPSDTALLNPFCCSSCRTAWRGQLSLYLIPCDQRGVGQALGPLQRHLHTGKTRKRTTTRGRARFFFPLFFLKRERKAMRLGWYLMNCFYSEECYRFNVLFFFFANAPTVSEFPLMQSSDKADEKHLPSWSLPWQMAPGFLLLSVLVSAHTLCSKLR